MSELKGGDKPITAELYRAGIGLRINVRCHPVIEEFFQRSQGLDSPQMEDVGAYGRHWERPKGSDATTDLQVYSIPKELTGVFNVGPGAQYRLDRPGSPLFVDDGLTRGTRLLNLSFLRLVGTSEGNGITFYIAGVYSEDTLDELDRLITLATREIYKQFMKPVKITITQEVREATDERTRVTTVEPPSTFTEAA
jgi:hypothetical protein